VVFSTAILLLGAGSVLAYYYVQTDRFRNTLEGYLEGVTGHDLNLDGRVTIEQLFGGVHLSLPDTTAKLREGVSGYDRLRFKGVSLAVSPSVLVSRGQTGDLSLDADSLAVIEASTSPSSPSSSTEPGLLSEDLGRLLDYIGELRFSVNVENITYVSRDTDQAASIFDFARLSANVSRQRIQVHGYYKQDAYSGYAFDVSASNIERLGTGRPALQGTLELDLARDESEPPRYAVRSDFDLAANDLSLSRIEVTVPGSRVNGNARIRVDEPLHVRANMVVNWMDLATWSGGESEPGPIFTDTPVGLDAVAGLGLDLDMQIEIKSASFGESPLMSGLINVAVKGNKLTVESEKLAFLKGPSKFRLRAKDMDGLPSVRLRFSTENFKVSQIPGGDGVSYLTSGDADAIVSFRSKGTSLDQLAEHADGYLVAALSNATLRDQYVAAVDTGLVTWTDSQLSRMMDSVESEPRDQAPEDEPFRIVCASAKARIRDGYILANNSIIVDLPQNRLVSTGYADLHTERIGFGFATKNRRSLDLSVISTVRYLTLLGTLSRPRISLAPEESILTSLEPDRDAARVRLPKPVRNNLDPIPKDLDRLNCVRSLD